jgi:hypothetical protein
VKLLSVVAIGLSLLGPSQEAKKVNAETVFDILSLFSATTKTLRPDELDKSFKTLGVAGQINGDVGSWRVDDDRGYLIAFTTRIKNEVGFNVSLTYNAPLAIAPAVLDAMMRGAISTKPGMGSTLVLVMPSEGIANPRCLKETQMRVSLQGELVSKQFSMLCPN